MSLENTRSKNGPQADNNVGYGRPPQKHQFKKGQSGNPNGRPRGSKNSLINNKYLGRFEKLVLEEAERDVTIKENGRAVKISAAQTVMRSIAMKAAQGSPASQKLYMEMVADVERRQDMDKLKAVDAALEYIKACKIERDRCEKDGTPFDPAGPLPEHIKIYLGTGEVTINGPASSEEREKIAYFTWRKETKFSELMKAFEKQENLEHPSKELDAEIDQLTRRIERLDKLLPTNPLTFKDMPDYKTFKAET